MRLEGPIFVAFFGYSGLIGKFRAIFFKISVSNIFENISKTVGFQIKATMNTYFVANLFSFPENFKFFKSVEYCQN